VHESFFNGERFADSLPRLLDAFVLDIKIFAWSMPAIGALALLIAVTRNSRSAALFPLRILTIAFTDIMRGVPIILWIYLIGFGVPGLGIDRPWNSPLIWGSVALVLTYSAYIAEVFRAGIESVHESQRAAARSLGLSSWQTMRHVVLPQAIRRVVPPLMNDMVSLQKDVALVSLIGPIEILRQGPSFTIDTVEAVAQSYPEDQIALIVGTDAFTKIDQWHRESELQDMVEFIVIDRPEFPGKSNLDIGALNISATQVRAGDLASVSPHVATYIKEHHLYASK
jgi:His/Glu/Gln/Arg/opine family amino acid ABC transporter permease subunit